MLVTTDLKHMTIIMLCKNYCSYAVLDGLVLIPISAVLLSMVWSLCPHVFPPVQIFFS